MKTEIRTEPYYVEMLVHTPKGIVRLTCSEYGAGIGLEGHSTMTAGDGSMDEIVFIDFDQADNIPVLSVWGDINLEDPTVRIPLRDSIVDNRKGG